MNASSRVPPAQYVEEVDLQGLLDSVVKQLVIDQPADPREEILELLSKPQSSGPGSTAPREAMQDGLAACQVDSTLQRLMTKAALRKSSFTVARRINLTLVAGCHV